MTYPKCLFYQDWLPISETIRSLSFSTFITLILKYPHTSVVIYSPTALIFHNLRKLARVNKKKESGVLALNRSGYWKHNFFNLALWFIHRWWNLPVKIIFFIADGVSYSTLTSIGPLELVGEICRLERTTCTYYDLLTTITDSTDYLYLLRFRYGSDSLYCCIVCYSAGIRVYFIRIYFICYCICSAAMPVPLSALQHRKFWQSYHSSVTSA